MTKKRQALGKWGEEIAANYLIERAYKIIERNARTPYGEIDIVAHQRTPGSDVSVFVEVKTRRSNAYGLPEEGVTRQKQARLLAASQAYLQEHPELDGDWRVDVIAIQTSHLDKKPQIVHFENAVR